MNLAGLLDLPTELLLQVLRDEQLRTLDLYSVGTLSKRLNSVAMPLFLASHSISNPHRDVLAITFNDESQPSEQNYDTSNDASVELGLAAGLMIAFDITSIRCLECTFPQSFNDISAFHHHISRLEHLILRLISVQSLTIQFDGDHKRRPMCSNPLSAVPVEIADTIGKIFEALITKGCKRLSLLNQSARIKVIQEIENEIPINHTTSLIRASNVGSTPRPGSTLDIPKKRPKGILRRAMAKLETFLDSPGSSISPPLPSKEIHLLYPSFLPPAYGLQTISSLQSLHIQTPFSLLPRCLPAVRNLIHSSIHSLTSLTLSHIVFHEELFDASLSALALNPSNSITHLIVVHCHRISSNNFLKFLSNFAGQLEYLEFDREISYIDRGDCHYTYLHFYELAVLKAPLDWVDYLLKMPTGDNDDSNNNKIPLPTLMYLTIYSRSPDSLYFTYRVFYPLLEPLLQNLHHRWLASELTNKVEVTLDMRLEKARTTQMDLDRIVFNLIIPSSTMPHREGSPENRHTQHGFPSSSTLRKAPEHWHLVNTLDLYPTPPPMDSFEANVFVQWVTTLFPGARRVNLSAPFIASLLTATAYRMRQKEIVDRAVVLLRAALRESKIDDDLPPYVWRTLSAGPWTMSLDD